MSTREGGSGQELERLRERVERLGRGEGAEAQPWMGDTLQGLRDSLDELHIQRELLETARREVETEREGLRRLFQLAPDAFLLTDAAGVIQEANRAASELLRVPDGSLPGVALSSFLAEVRRAGLNARLLSLQRRGENTEMDLAMTPRAGGPLEVSAVVAAAREGDRVVGFRWLLRDVTQARRAERATRRLMQEQAARVHAQAAEQRNAFLAEASEILAGSLDYATTLASVSRLAVPRLADSCIAYVVEEDGTVCRPGVAHADPAREEALLAVLNDRPFDPGSLMGPVARVLRTGEPELIPCADGDEAWPGRDGPDGGWNAADVAPAALMVVPLRIRERTLGALSLGWDDPARYAPADLWLARKLADRAALAIENARLHREARRASEAKSEFLAAMSHEFRTPLTAIVAFADLMVAGIPEPLPEASRGQAERILAAGRHLSHLIDQVLTLSRLDAEHDRARNERVDLGALARDAAQLIEPLATQKGLRFVVELPPAGPAARTDPNKLRQVLFNLLGNAVKFTDAGEVRLALRTGAGRAVFEVRDTGEGIAPEHLGRIWEPFWQAGGARDGRPPGTGLGLGITRRLVRLLGGEVGARSEPGRGSVFTVTLALDGGEG